MSEFVNMIAMYLSKQRKKAAIVAEITSTESVTLNISEKYLELLKSSFKILDFSLNEAENFSKEVKMFETLENRIFKMLAIVTSDATDIKFDDIIAFALTLYNFGVVHIKITKMNCDNRKEKETNSLYKKAEKFLTSCLILLKGKETEQKAILIAMRSFDKLSYIFIEQQKLEHCYKLLVYSLHIYLEYVDKKYPNPIEVVIIILGIDDEKNANKLDHRIFLDNLHIKILKKLSILYNQNLDNKHEYVGYMYVILNNVLKEDFLHKHYMEWAITAGELSQYFIKNNRFTEAKNYLAAASYMMEKYNVEKLKTMMTETIINNQNTDLNILRDTLHEDYQCIYAKIANFWGQYGIQLLHASREKLLQNKENQSCEDNNLERECSTKFKKESANFLIFTNMGEELKDNIKIYDKYSSNFSDVKIIFQKALEWFDKAIAYFTMEKDIKTHRKILLNKSVAYKYLAGLEQCKDKRIKIYEQQIVFLVNVFTKLSQSTAVNDIKKLIWLELGISCSTILNIMHESDNNLNMLTETYNKTLWEIERQCNIINSSKFV